MSLNFFAMTQHNLLGLKKYKQQMLTAIVKSILIITIPILLYFMMGINGILLGMAISNLVVCSPYFMSLRKNIVKFQDIKKKFRAITGNFGIDLSSTFPIVADKLLIVPLFGFVYVGIYQFNLQILFALGILPVILHAFLLPEEASGKIHKKIIYISIIVSFVIVILGIFFAPIVVNELFPKYHDGIQSLQIMIVSLIPLSISSVFSAKLQARESTKIGISAIVRVASLLGLIMLLGDLYGLEGFSYAVLISTILYAVSLAILYYFSRSLK